ncbi:MAG: hypothetical protein M3126_10650 [Candidatus Eremiobacteraeota bacterium]|nr:hypothetical protein [Candidatus Eremiobacteraeota bacterium]
MNSRIFTAVLLALAIAGCGGGKSTTTTTTTNGATPVSETQRENAALPQGAMAPVPAGLNCGATKPVWANAHTKAYHEAGDPYYGRTKRGQYMCASAAAAQGYHAAGTGHMSNANSNGSMGGSTKRKHHRNGGGSMNAYPDATATP